ncbi:MAG: aspartate-semialdehyde dehydrogenase [Holosporales bacterium]|jgi:aspartate-semialdehyde dehydrogenase|nr:aspartate-semialdehyde dehydrogenase [Holosporales bacterium]
MNFQENIKFAIVGATGIVGLEFLKILEKENVLSNKIIVAASKNSVGSKLKYKNDFLIVEDLEEVDFSNCKIGLFSPGAKVSEIYAPIAEKQGCFVIDNTSFFRTHEDVPLIVPEINLEELKNAKRKIIANPNCSTIQLVMVLKPIQDICKIKRVFVSTYQSVSGAGKDALGELNDENTNSEKNVIFPQKIKKNVIPKIDTFLSSGETKEEWKMFVETRKILNSDIVVSSTCVRVPVEVGHSEAVFFELEHDVPIKEIHEAIRKFPGVYIEDLDSNEFKTPREIAGTDEVFVSRLRKDENTKCCYQMWIVADNVRKGAALNAVQIAKGLVSYGIV